MGSFGIARRLVGMAVTIGMLVGCGTAARLATADSGDLKGLAQARKTMSLWVMPDAGITPLISALTAAQKSIRIELYMLTDHDATAQIVQTLVDRAKAGVDVEVILEAKPYIPPAPPSCQPDPASSDVNGEAIKALLAGGVKVKRSSPKFKFTHEKAMVIDGTTAYIMTCNWSNSAFVSNREYVILDRDSTDVGEVLKIFQADWDETAYHAQAPNLVVSPDNSRQKILALIDGAKKSLIVESEYLSDPEVAQHLGARAKAGVNVVVMLSYQPKDPCSGNDTNAQEKQLLAQNGIGSVAFTQTVTMHAKAIVADGAIAYVGSENFTANSLDNNREMGVLVRDPGILSTLTATANRDWASR
jgi:phosphatidylserine/phosphatidylglycerophosphate/cardiolipin synthase-like enzyme